MRRLICMILTALGTGLIVGGVSFTPTAPADPVHLLEAVLQKAPTGTNVAELNQLITFAIERSQARPTDPREHDKEVTMRAVASALKGFGTAFLVLGVLGLVLPLIYRGLKPAAASSPATP